MARNRRGCGCAVAALVVLLAVAGFAGWKFFKPWWERRQADQSPPASGDELRVHVLDVGHGDSILIIAPGGKVVLVDAGPQGSGKRINEALKRYGADHIDLFFATHAHADHIGAADEIIKATPVSKVFYNGEPYTTKHYQEFLKSIADKKLELEKVAPGQVFELGGGAVLRVVAPIPPSFGKEDVLRAGGNEPNANSLVMRLNYGQFSMLLAGDAESITEQRMMREGAAFAASFLKVAHHGSQYASSEDFLKRGGFKTAIISVGADNRYGQPHADALNHLRAAGVRLYRTDFQGDITVSTHGKEGDAKISTAREPRSGEDLWAGREPLRDDSAKRGFIDFGELPPPPKPRAETPKNTRTANTAR